jgi:transposase
MMDQSSETKTPIRRRRHSTAFKARVLEEIKQPGTSIASVAQRHGLNANLIHKWRKTAERNDNASATLPAFVAVEASVTATSEPAGTIVLELPFNHTTLTIRWPVGHAPALAHWLKAMRS